MTQTCSGHGHEGTCERCGAFICPACRKWVDERPHCASCHAAMRKGASPRAIAALGLAAAGLCLLVPGPVAALLAALELAAIRGGRAPRAGRDYAVPALALGGLETLILVGIVARWISGGSIGP